MMTPVGKVMLKPKDDYDASVTYDVLDMVRHDNKLWIAKQSNILNVEPAASNSDYWMLATEQSMTMSNSIAEEGQYALDAVEKNPLIEGTMAYDMQQLQKKQDNVADNIVIFEESDDNSDDLLLDDLIRIKLSNSIAVTFDENDQRLQFMYGDVVVGSAILKGIVAEEIPSTSISLDQETFEDNVLSNNHLVLVPTVEPIDCTQRIRWYSSNDFIATVDNGIVTRVTNAEQSCIIYAKCGNHTATCTVSYIMPKFIFEMHKNIADNGELISDDGKGFWIASNKLSLPKGTIIKFSDSTVCWAMYAWDKTGKSLGWVPENAWHTGGSYTLPDDYMIRIRFRTAAWGVFTEDGCLKAQNSVSIVGP